AAKSFVELGFFCAVGRRGQFGVGFRGRHPVLIPVFFRFSSALRRFPTNLLELVGLYTGSRGWKSYESFLRIRTTTVRPRAATVRLDPTGRCQFRRVAVLRRGEVSTLEVQGNVHQPYQSGDLDQRSDDGGKRCARVDRVGERCL